MLLSIKDIKVYIVSPGTAHYVTRLHTVFERLVSNGFKRVEFFRSVASESELSKKETGVSIHTGTDSLSRTILAILEHELVGGMRNPFIIVEDDVQVFHKYDLIEIPDDADAVYLGVSKWIYPHKYETLGRGFHIQENGPTHVKDATEYTTRILGMTSGHAILFLNPEYVRRFIAAMMPRLPFSTPHDLVYATLQPEFNVFALKKPMFYQDGTLGGQEAVTRLVYDGACYRAV